MSILEYPEVKEIFSHLFDTLLDESERGAIIIGTTKVEEQLEKYIRKILPNDSKTYTKKLLDYPGVLSSFSSKIELAYAFRLINENLYTSLNALRKIRNEAAHSSNSFSISEIRGRFEEVFDLGPSIAIIIRKQAMEMMMELKMKNIEWVFDENNLTNEEKKEQLNSIIENKELMDRLEKQIPRWELIYGLSLICGFIKHEEEGTAKLLSDSKTWNNLNTKNKKEESVQKNTSPTTPPQAQKPTQHDT